MGKLTEIFEIFFPSEKAEVMQPGFYHYQTSLEHPDNYRLHLRIEPDGTGILVINASTVVHLNQTAAEYAYHLVNQTPHHQAISSICKRYDVKKSDAERDFHALIDQVEVLVHTVDLEPISHLGLERTSPYSQRSSAPFRLDCALTYQLPQGASQDAAPSKRVTRELSTDEWKTIIDKAWSLGIPQLLFTGGEPTLREDLGELIAHAELNGQVCGILTNGLKLGDTKYLKTILEAGLDHAMILLEPTRDQSWESLSSFAYWSETLDDDIYVSVHLTITEGNQTKAEDLIDRLVEAGISALSLSTNDKSLTDRLEQVRQYANHKDLELIWDIPVPYSNLNPVALELDTDDSGEVSLDGAGRGWLYVEPDGDVLPGQGINRVLGNMLTTPWETIWQKAAED